MEKLFEQHYQAIKKRGKITPLTTTEDFNIKLDEETTEFLANPDPQEAVDVMCVMSNWLKHYGYDLKTELEKNLNHQINRND